MLQAVDIPRLVLKQDRNKPFRERRPTSLLQLQRKHDWPERQTLRSVAPLFPAYFAQEANAGQAGKCPFVRLNKGDLQPSPKRGPKGDEGKDSSAIAKQTKAGVTLETFYARVWINRISTKEKPQASRGKQQQIQLTGPITT